MRSLEKLKIRTFGPRTVRTRTPLFVSMIVLVATLLFVGVGSASLGFIELPAWMPFQHNSNEERVAGVSVSQVVGNCPVGGLIITPPAGTTPWPLPTTINQTPSGQTPPTINSGKYSVSGTLTINGELRVNGAVEIYATAVNITANGNVNADFTGNAGGAGGQATNVQDASHNITQRNAPNPLAGEGVGYCANGQPGCTYSANTTGGGAARSNYQAPDGAGGGGHAGAGGSGSNGTGQPGGAANYAGQPGDYAVRMGSGGGGGYCKGGGNNCYGGRGGGSIAFFATNFSSQGQIHANGQPGLNVIKAADEPICETARFGSSECPPGRKRLVGYNGYQEAAGGGGAGGGILISTINGTLGGTLSVKGGNGGNASCTNKTTCTEVDDAGGGGGGGEIKVFHDPAGTFTDSSSKVVVGGSHGDQGAPNLPKDGDGGVTTNGSCATPPPPKCSTGWSFGLSCTAVVPVRGQTVFIAANLNSFDFQNDPLEITTQLNQYESATGSGIVYGDWWGPSFTATKGNYYKACYDVQASGGAQPMPWSNSYAATATRFYTDSVSPGNEFNVQTNIQPPLSGWTRNERVFQASWGASATSAASYLEFRTGSFIGGWFVGNLNLDNVGIFNCGTNASCSNVPPCSPTLVGSSSNIVSGPVRNGTFEGSNDINLNVWRHATAAPTGVNASTHQRILEASGNHYLQIQSANYFAQSVDQNCTPQFPGGSCYHWRGTQSLPNADFQLYTIATVLNTAPCNTTLPNAATGKLNSCDARSANCDTQPVACVGQVPTFAQVLPPYEVCANQPATFNGLVSAPVPSLGDTHAYTWSTFGGNPGIPTPKTGSEQDASGQKQISTTFNAGNNPFTLKLDIVSQKGAPASHAEHLINVVNCAPGAPGTYLPDPSEDIHASGRASIDPAPGISNTQKKILDWREILGNLF